MNITFHKRTASIIACLPAAWVVLLGLLVLRTHSLHSDPSLYPMAKFTPFGVHFTITQILFLASPLIAVGAAFHILWARCWVPGFRSGPIFLLLGLSVALCVATIVFNPGGIFFWFFD